MKKRLFTALTACALTLTASTAYAECNLSDPCAPKKEKDAWHKGLAVGFNKTTGNSDTTLVSILGNFSKETDEDLTDGNFLYNYGEDKNTTNDNGNNTTRDDFRADASYNYKFTPRAYVGFGSKYLHDQIADIDYRLNLNPTIGYFLVKNADISFALEGGPGYTFEEVAEISNDHFSPRLGDRFEWMFPALQRFFKKREFSSTLRTVSPS